MRPTAKAWSFPLMSMVRGTRDLLPPLLASLVLVFIAAACAEPADTPFDVIHLEETTQPEPDFDEEAEGEEEGPGEVDEDFIPDVPVDPSEGDEDAGEAEEDPLEDPPLDPPPEDEISDPDVEPDPDIPEEIAGVGIPYCGTAGVVPDCRLLSCGAAHWSAAVNVPAVYNGRVMKLEIQVSPRWVFIEKLPFNDLQASLTSPSGAKKTFWNRFYGNDSWESDFIFVQAWLMPSWWDTPFGGSWTLEFKDYEISGLPPIDTQVTSWCLTPMDNAAYASVDPGASLSRCYTSAHGITDYCDGDDPPDDPCDTHPIQMELQITELVKAAAAPRLTLELTHPDLSELRIVLKGPEGVDVTVWNRASGSLPAFFPLDSLLGTWMAGRWALEITDYTEGNVGTVNRWCVEAN